MSPTFYHIQTISSRCTIHLNVKGKIYIKILENMGQSILYPEVDKNLLNRIYKASTIKENFDKLESIKIKSFYSKRQQ